MEEAKGYMDFLKQHIFGANVVFWAQELHFNFTQSKGERGTQNHANAF